MKEQETVRYSNYEDVPLYLGANDLMNVLGLY